MKGTKVSVLVIVSVILSSLLTMILLTSSQPLQLVVQNILGIHHPVTLVQNSGGETLKLPQGDFGKGKQINSPEIERFMEAYSIIKDSYYDKELVESKDLIEGAIHGMINVLGDPYTTYMDSKESKIFNESLGTSFEGIGTEVMMLNNRVTIISPFKDSPAEKAGLKPNDQIIKVDGENIEGLSLQDAVEKIRGPKGTKVKLEIIRPGMTHPLTIVVIRDTIPIETVYVSEFTVAGKKIGKIEITSFSENTAERFIEEFTTLRKQGIQGLIIDVRGNPGGYLESVLNISEQLVPNKGTIVQVEDRSGKRVQYKSTLRDNGFPLVVLVNQGSASASEILAGALKDAGYPIIGQPTFGKGTVQVPKSMSDGGNIKITIAKWLTPDGTWVNEKGVLPTVEIEQPDYFKATPIHIEKSLKRDMTGAEIQNVQLILQGIGFQPGRIDGYFDESTEIAVRSFQKVNNLSVTGIVDKETANKLEQLLIEKIRDPKNDLQLQTALKILADSLK